jgi:hypothetical protein
MVMKSEPKKTPRATDLRELVREVLASAREESARQRNGQTKPKAQRQPDQS